MPGKWSFWFWKRAPEQPQRTNRGGDPLPISVRSEPLVGYRMWRVRPDPLVLTSLNIPYTWEVDNRAECLPPPAHPMWMAMHPTTTTSKHEEPAPCLECACGLYASLPNQPLREWEHTIAGVVHASGSVALSGRVIRCTMGYKAEHAQIQSPVVLGAWCASSQSCREDVAAIDVQSDRIRGWCASHAPDGADSAVVWFTNAAAELEQRYPPLEFLSYV